MKKIFFSCLLFFLVCSNVYSGIENRFPEPEPKTEIFAKAKFPRHVEVRTYIHHISDINFRQQEYKVELWLYLTTKDTCRGWNSIEQEFEVVGAKEISATVIPIFQKRARKDSGEIKETEFRKLIKLNCTMSQDWHLDNYPFDRQKLEIIIYTIRSTGWLELHPYKCNPDCPVNNQVIVGTIENGWRVNANEIRTQSTLQNDLFDLDKQYSAIHLSIPISRTENLALFIKLFTGMYVSFFVAFLAFFVGKNHIDPKFGLTVGGLFAAIGNKYIMESILPQTSGMTIVDSLHTSTIVSILLIILFLAISVSRSENRNGIIDFRRSPRSFFQKFMTEFDKHSWILILTLYLTLNIVCIIWGMGHHGS